MQLWSSQDQWEHMTEDKKKKGHPAADGGVDGAGEKDERREEHT